MMSNSSYYEWLEDLFEVLCTSLSSFADSELFEVRSYVDNREYGLAIETVYFIVIEENKKISDSAYKIIVEITNTMNTTLKIDVARLIMHVY